MLTAGAEWLFLSTLCTAKRLKCQAPYVRASRSLDEEFQAPERRTTDTLLQNPTDFEGLRVDEGFSLP